MPLGDVDTTGGEGATLAGTVGAKVVGVGTTGMVGAIELRTGALLGLDTVG